MKSDTMKHINAEIDDKVRDIRFNKAISHFLQATDFLQTIDFMRVEIRSKLKFRTIERMSIATLRNLEKEIGYGKH